MKHTLLILWMCIGYGVAARAQLSLEACQTMARNNYPLIKKYDLIRQSTDYTVNNLKKGWLPQVQATAQVTVQNRVAKLPDALTGLMAHSGYDFKGLSKEQYRVQLDVSQMLWDGGRIRRKGDAARLQGAVEEAQTDVSLYEVRRRVNDLFFGLLLIDEKIQLNNDLLVLLQSNEDKLAAMLRRGVVMQSDVDRLKAERLNAVQTGIELASARRSMSAMLAGFCGITAIDGLVKPRFEEVNDDWANARPELRLIETRLRMTDAQGRLLKSDLMPGVSVFAQGYYGYPGYDMFKDMLERKMSFNGLVGARLTWNIGSLYTHKNNLKKLAVQRSEAENARELFLFNSRMDEMRQRETMASRRKVMQTDDEIVALRASVRQAAEAKLAHGIIDTDHLLQEITRENTARIIRSTHEIELLQSIYEIKYILGKSPIVNIENK